MSRAHVLRVRVQLADLADEVLVNTLRSKNELESEVSTAIIRFKREYMGRGPEEVRTYLVEDMVIVRLKGVLTPAEQRLAKVEDPHRGRDLIKQIRIELIEHGRELLEAVVRDILGVGVLSLHTDISTRTGESVLVFTLERRPAFKPPQQA